MHLLTTHIFTFGIRFTFTVFPLADNIPAVFDHGNNAPPQYGVTVTLRVLNNRGNSSHV